MTRRGGPRAPAHDRRLIFTHCWLEITLFKENVDSKCYKKHPTVCLALWGGGAGPLGVSWPGACLAARPGVLRGQSPSVSAQFWDSSFSTAPWVQVAP